MLYGMRAGVAGHVHTHLVLSTIYRCCLVCTCHTYVLRVPTAAECIESPGGSPSLDLNLHPVFSPRQYAARSVLVLSCARWIAEAHPFSARYDLVWMRILVLARKRKGRRMFNAWRSSFPRMFPGDLTPHFFSR